MKDEAGSNPTTLERNNHMQRFYWAVAVGMVLAGTSSVNGQVVKGVMAVTQSHMS
jgi:hypothetical protein